MRMNQRNYQFSVANKTRQPSKPSFPLRSWKSKLNSWASTIAIKAVNQARSLLGTISINPLQFGRWADTIE